MARRKQTEAPDTDLPELTDKQLAFVQGKARGLSNADAYREAYDAHHQAPNVVWANAARVAGNAKVRLWLASAQDDARAETGYTRAATIKRLLELSERAEQAGNLGAAVQAADKAAEYAGHKVHQYADVTEAPDIVAWLDKRAKEIEGDPDALDQLQRIAERYGVQWTPDSKTMH